MKIYTLKLLTTSKLLPSRMQTSVIEALGKHSNDVSVDVQRASSEALEIKISGERRALGASHMQISKDFAAEHPFIRLVDELGDELRNQAYPILSRLEQELRAFINEAMISAGMGINWLEMVADDRISTRIQATIQKSQSAIYQHPVEFTELDHLLEIVTLDLASWASHKPITTEDLINLLEGGNDLKEIKETLARRMKKRSFWDAVFSPFFDDLASWHSWKSRWKKEVIGLRNRVMHHRPVFEWEVLKLRETADEFAHLLSQHRKTLSTQEKIAIRQSALELFATYRTRNDLHMAMGGVRQSAISISKEAGVIFLFDIGIPTISTSIAEDGREEFLVLYQGEGRRTMEMTRGNLAIYDHAAQGMELQMFSYMGKSRDILHLGQAEYRRHFFNEQADGASCLMFELALKPSIKLRELNLCGTS